MKAVKNFFIGAFLTIVGLFLFFRNVTFSDPSNTGLLGGLMGMLFGEKGPKAATGILIVVICVAFLIFAFSPNGFTASLMCFSVILVILMLVASLQMKIADIGGAELLIIMAMFLGGIGLAGRSAIMLTFPDKASK